MCVCVCVVVAVPLRLYMNRQYICFQLNYKLHRAASLDLSVPIYTEMRIANIVSRTTHTSDRVEVGVIR